MSVYWVKDTVNADAVGTVDTFADPFGIQKAFDTATAGDEIRIVTGANNYNSGSTSWTNRDDSTFTINVDTNAGTTTNPITVSGYTDETTEGLVALDFDSASITGSNGFTVSNAANNLFWKNIRVTDCDDDGWDMTGVPQEQILYLCRADNNGGIGLNAPNVSVARPIACQFDNNSSHGMVNISNAVLCELNNNSGSGQGAAADNVTAVMCLCDGNTVTGYVQDDRMTYVNCTFEENADGLVITSGNAQPIIINCGFTNNTSYGIDGTTGFIALELNCGYFNNSTGLTNVAGIGQQVSRVTTDPGYSDAANRDYSLGDNWKAAGAGGFLGGDSTGYIDIGAVQREEAVGGGLSIVNTRRNMLIGR